MENENPENVLERITLEEAQIIIKVIEKTLPYREFVKPAILGEDFKLLTTDQQVDTDSNPRFIRQKSEIGRSGFDTSFA